MSGAAVAALALALGLGLAVAAPPPDTTAADAAAAEPAAPSSAPAPAGQPRWELADEWRQRGRNRLQLALERLRLRDPLAECGSGGLAGGARNVIVFIGDGMGVATTTAAGLLKGGEGTMLAWERFPVVGLAKTYSADHQVPDSASTATAILTGVKTCSRTLGLDARVNKTTCDADQNKAAALPSAATWAHAAGRLAGLVTTARVTHATPAALYARINHRDWECDGELPPTARSCVPDIARQLVGELPGRELRVVLGGGRRQLGVTGKEDPDADDDSCVRGDGRNLATEWTSLPGERRFVTTAQQLLAPGLTEEADYLMGLFAGGHMAYEAERVKDSPDQPSLTDMTRVAIRMLRRQSSQGFFLLVEGARVDMAHHLNYARLALLEALQLDEAVTAALQEVDLADTLVLVTGDHSHAMTINGYPERGSDVLGIAYPEDERNNASAVKYETITYSTGPGAADHAGRRVQDIPEAERSGLRYRHEAGLFTGHDETHAGEDVPVYAVGPGADLLAGVFEQSYIATAVAYAAGIGEFGGPGARPAICPLGDGAAAGPASGAGAPAAAATLLTLLLTLLLAAGRG